jgi:hypothetical protein
MPNPRMKDRRVVHKSTAGGFNNPLHELADWMQFTLFMRFLDGSQPVAFSASARRGQRLFGTDVNNPGISCFLCHTPTMQTAAATEIEALQNKPANLYSDLLVHHMGQGLADRITQGRADGDMFRTTPLWGVGKRIFLLHDGRTSDLLQGILAHASFPGDPRDGAQSTFPPSEANAVIAAFRSLSPLDDQAIPGLPAFLVKRPDQIATEVANPVALKSTT